ncbi:hypothetical protein [Spongiimicrobium salis]|uniref:hypothetical protein n=1 Tax=Spongiimicrobium salis TaxID=1667022 RepID=UPI00374CCE52
MKTTLKFTAILALVLCANLGYASNAKHTLVTDNDTKSIVFQLDASNEEMNIRLTDEQGNVIYSESVEDQKNYIKKFDLTNLENGRYFFKTDNALKTVTYSLDINKQAVTILDKKEVAKPVFNERANVLYMNLLNQTGEKVKMELVDQANRTIFEETLTDQFLVGKAFNFENAFKGTYTLMVKTSKGVYYHEVRIK